MQHPLSTTWVIGIRPDGVEYRSRVATVTAEMNIGPSPQMSFPDAIDGKLVDVPQELLLQLKFGRGVDVTFSGKSYRFGSLESDGRFQLHKDW